MLTTRLPGKIIKAVTIWMLVLHIFLPAHGPAHLFELFAGDESRHAESVSIDVLADSSRDSTGEQQHNPCSCELDAPYDIAPCQALEYSPLVVRLQTPYAGGLLPGYGIPIFVPPQVSA